MRYSKLAVKYQKVHPCRALNLVLMYHSLAVERKETTKSSPLEGTEPGLSGRKD